MVEARESVFVRRPGVRFVLALTAAAALTGAMLLAPGGRSVRALVYNVPVFVVFGLWLTRAGEWLRRGRWGELVVGAAALTAAMMRVGMVRVEGGFPASGHATFLAYATLSARRDGLLVLSAAAVLIEVTVMKAVRGDWLSLWTGLALGTLLGVVARALDRRRTDARPRRETP